VFDRGELPTGIVMNVTMRSVAGALQHKARAVDIERRIVTRVRDAPKRFPADLAGRPSVRVLTIGSDTGPARRSSHDSCVRTVVAEVADVGFCVVDHEPRWVSVPSSDHLMWLRALMLDHCIDEIHVVDTQRVPAGVLDATIESARELGVPVCFTRPEAVEWLHRHPSHGAGARALKRAIDLLLSSALLLMVSPLLAAIAIAIVVTHGGPVLFRQPRVGYRRRQFMMMKFRTMVANAEDLRANVALLNSAKGISFKIVADPRVTAVGGMLRRLSLDELPQLVNVLLGDMSLVGPRPIPVWVAEQLREPRYYRRFSVRPGVSGWWQINGRTQDFDVMATQDLEYVDRWSHFMDIKIIGLTVPAILRGEGSTEPVRTKRELT
jgi:lipopolysaccharide/colanic/teichoic acid biosynthesis glycosyltransferase